MKKHYQKPELELVSLDLSEAITWDDSDVGLESNPWLQMVLEDEAALLEEIALLEEGL